MEVARNVAARHMESLALAELGLDETTVTNIKDERVTDKFMFSFDILCIWRNKSEEHTKQVRWHFRINLIHLVIFSLKIKIFKLFGEWNTDRNAPVTQQKYDVSWQQIRSYVHSVALLTKYYVVTSSDRKFNFTLRN